MPSLSWGARVRENYWEDGGAQVALEARTQGGDGVQTGTTIQRGDSVLSLWQKDTILSLLSNYRVPAQESEYQGNRPEEQEKG